MENNDKMNKSDYSLLMYGSLGIGLSIILGAFAAHSLKESIGIKELSIFETGVKYQFFGCIGILLLGLISGQSGVSLKKPALLLAFGIVLFSASLYLLAIRGLIGLENATWLGAITPFGGLAMISAWIWVGIKMAKKSKSL